MINIVERQFDNKNIYHDHYSAYGKYSDEEWVESFWRVMGIKQNYILTKAKYA